MRVSGFPVFFHPIFLVKMLEFRDAKQKTENMGVGGLQGAVVGAPVGAGAGAAASTAPASVAALQLMLVLLLLLLLLPVQLPLLLCCHSSHYESQYTTASPTVGGHTIWSPQNGAKTGTKHQHLSVWGLFQPSPP